MGAEVWLAHPLAMEIAAMRPTKRITFLCENMDISSFCIANESTIRAKGLGSVHACLLCNSLLDAFLEPQRLHPGGLLWLRE